MRKGRPPIKKVNIVKGHRLEVPVFLTLEKILNRRFGKPIMAVGGPTADGQNWSEPTWERAWSNYLLSYRRLPQAYGYSVHQYPDVILYRVNGSSQEPILAIECKNYTKGTNFTLNTYQRYVIDYFEWLPPECSRKLVCSYRNIIECDEEALIDASNKANIQCFQLEMHAGPPNPTRPVYAKLERILPVWVKKVLQND